MRRVIGLLLVFLYAPSLASAAQTPFQSAVAFALTGRDDTPLKVINRADCVFGAGDRTYYLNNVDPDRIQIQGWTNKTAYGETNYFIVKLRGESTIYDYNKMIIPEVNLWPESMRESLRLTRPDLFQPHRDHMTSSQVEITVPTAEGERLGRAWRYVYSNGCSGKKSQF